MQEALGKLAVPEDSHMWGPQESRRGEAVLRTAPVCLELGVGGAAGGPEGGASSQSSLNSAASGLSCTPEPTWVKGGPCGPAACPGAE